MLESLKPHAEKSQAFKSTRYLNHGDALSLAKTIADGQEQRNAMKINKHRHGPIETQRRERETASLASRDKMRSVKAALAARRTQAKREKSRNRRDDFKAKAQSREDGRKIRRVAFHSLSPTKM
ncbi:hypothetical protein CPB83DRAFT_854739 [Crepidotus variabilis]|uniref:Uncharacterized protein n=1 Tax=Crepidotus variabilis TaxID=179855 RepID=A0A9P6EG37_9AGAR|nr:hypothetical protein CPB83DRAFT_854739 [Crepidotus variabilis]